MPELYNAIFRLYREGNMEQGRLVQNECCRIIYRVCEARGNMYALLKEVIRRRGGPDAGGVRAPLLPMVPEDGVIADRAAAMIDTAIAQYC